MCPRGAGGIGGGDEGAVPMFKDPNDELKPATEEELGGGCGFCGGAEGAVRRAWAANRPANASLSTARSDAKDLALRRSAELRSVNSW
jgi:hypothetical protein